MNKKGLTILELLLSISLTAIVLLLLLKLIFSLESINNNKSYASEDEITRTEIIKKIESDFLNLKLNGLELSDSLITFTFKDNTIKKLKINFSGIEYDNELTTLKSKNATYSCPTYKYIPLENNYYLIELIIPVLIANENNTEKDDIVLTYIGLKDEATSYPESYLCTK